MNRVVTKQYWIAIICIAVNPFSLSAVDVIMIEHEQQSEGGFANSIPPPLIDVRAAQQYYQERLFNGRFGLPTIGDIAEINAEIYQPGSGLPPVPNFTVPTDYYDKLFAFFKGGTIEPSPNFALWEVGTLMIRAKDGTLRRICWFGGTRSPLLFSLNGVRCIGTQKGADVRDESIALERLLREANEKLRSR